ncbi:hypothetical protein [Nocardia callitridis]|uniref:Uncharacterized protein n=1 Tax=Nocardia callitridis TaxID=648753 RepID=A0ABP9JWJ8_9NOCA
MSFDPKSWSPLRAVDLGKRLYDRSWLDQWVALSTSWVDPVADLGAGTVTALLPDVVMTGLSEGILSRFGGRQINATLLEHELEATLDVLKVRRRGAHFQTKTVLSRLRWDGHSIEEVTVIAHGVRLIPGVPTRVRAASVDIEGSITTAALLGWLNAQPLDWALGLDPSGLVLARHRTKRVSALLDGAVLDNRLILDLHRASRFGIRLPRRMIDLPALSLTRLPSGAHIEHATRQADRVHFRVRLPQTAGSFDLTQIRNAIVAGTRLIVF